MTKTLLRYFLVVCVLWCAATARGGEYPDRPVRLLVPFPPGGASDFAGRALAAGLTETLGQQFIVDNRGGASGVIATELAVKSAPNGYTLFLGNVNSQAINPHIFRMTVDPVKDMVAISPVITVPSVIVGHVSVTGSTLKEFLAHTLRSGRDVRVGVANLSTPGRFQMMAFLKSMGVKVVEVPYNGAGPALTALLAGETEILGVTVISAVGPVKSGRLKALGMATTERVPLLPDVPTMAELGYPGLVYGQWNGLFGPAALPRSIVVKLHEATTSTMKKEQIIQRLAASGADAVSTRSPEEYAAFVRGESARWAKIIRESGLASR
jgi:tripartite-type tricarboxylate transporter receptor subunit TctC